MTTKKKREDTPLNVASSAVALAVAIVTFVALIVFVAESPKQMVARLNPEMARSICERISAKCIEDTVAKANECEKEISAKGFPSGARCIQDPLKCGDAIESCLEQFRYLVYTSAAK